MGSGLLSASIWLPIAFGVLLLVVGRDDNPNPVRWIALVGAVLGLLVTIPLLTGFDTTTAALQFEENLPWIDRFNVRYHLGIDGLSVWFVVLTAFITLITVVAGWEVITERVAQYFAAFLILSGLMIGVFCAADAMLFYVFFEASLIPMYMIIGMWGGPRRIYAAFKFFLYTMLGSLLMLVAMFYLYFESGGSFDIATWQKLPLSMTPQALLFFAFWAAFSVKVPMWPVHTWLPDAHVEAPTGGSVVLAAIMLKLGAYGFVRFSMPISPDASREYAWFIVAISLIAVVYIGLVAIVQTDMKKLIAYSSVAHMGFVTLGFFIFSELGVSGGLVQMVSHGFVSGAMFLTVGVLYERVHSREIAAYGGVVNTMPRFAAFALFFSMAMCGLPGTSGFVGEWMVILATVKIGFWLAALAATALVLGAAYSLWLYKRVWFGKVGNGNVAVMKDLSAREFGIMAALAIATLWIGVYPKPLTDVMHTSVTNLLDHMAVSKLQ